MEKKQPALDPFESEDFIVDVVGDITGTKWFGKFKCKRALSHRDRMVRDKLRRDHLGEHPAEADKDAKDAAYVLSELAVRVVEAPAWWAASNGGQDLVDYNTLSEVFRQCIKAEAEFIKQVEERNSQARDKLRASAADLDKDQ